jgi:hypothetical protein
MTLVRYEWARCAAREPHQHAITIQPDDRSPCDIRGVEHGNDGRSRSSSSSPTAQTGVIILAHPPHTRRDGPSA